MKIAEKLQIWVQEGLIQSSQADSILAFENQKHTRPYAMYSFIILGVTVISIGIISLIAANWEAIPDLVKLVVDLILLSVTAYAIFHYRDHLIGYAISVLFCFLILASIGLISQIYHTGGPFYLAVFFTLALTAPLVLLQNGRLLIHLWTLGFCFSFLSWITDGRSFSDATELVLFFTLGSILLISAFILRQAGSSLETHHGVVFFWAVLILTIGSMIFSFAAFEESSIRDSQIETFVLLPSILLVCSAAYAFFFLPRSVPRKVMIIIAFALLYFLFFFSVYVYPVGDKETYLAIIFILLAMASAIVFFDRRFVFDTFLVLAGIRFLIIYFEVFEDLATTGIGLILAGLVIIGGVVVYAKTRSRIQGFLTEKLK